MIVILAILASSSRTLARSLVRTLALIFRITTLGLEAANSISLDRSILRALRAYMLSLRNYSLSLPLLKTIAISLLERVHIAIALALSNILAIASLIRLISASARIRFSFGISLVLRIASGRRLVYAEQVGRELGRLIGPGPGPGLGPGLVARG